MAAYFAIAAAGAAVLGAGLGYLSILRNTTLEIGDSRAKQCYAVFKEGGWPADQANLVAASYGGYAANDMQLQQCASSSSSWDLPAWTATPIFSTRPFFTPMRIKDGRVEAFPATVQSAGVAIYGPRPDHPFPGHLMSS